MGLADDVDRVFAPDGPLERAWPGFEARSGQRRLAREVAHVLEAGGTLLAEAGTGIGKTLAYLVPAVLSGWRVIVSTGTRTLQDQVFYKDVPALARALGTPIRAAYMKGRTNYLCRHRFGRVREAGAGLPFDDRRYLEQIEEWAAITTTGDRAEIEDLPDDLPFWTEITATSDQCLGRECPEYTDCFITRMRQTAADAAIVIVNHHLLCADASVRQGTHGEVIPDCEVAIVDEAHQLEDIVTAYFGVSLSPFRVDELVRDAMAAAAAAGGRDREDARRPSAGDLTSGLHDIARRLFDTARLELRSHGGGDRLSISPEVAGRLQDVGLALRDALERLARGLQPRGEDVPDLASVAARALAMAGEVEQILASDDPDFVRYIEVRGRTVFLRAAPIDVAGIVRDQVLGGRRATVLTSATLTVEASFDYARTRLGLPDATAVRVPSEFDYRTHALLYLPPDMPDPRSPDFNRAAAGVIAELLARSRGRAFVLFTSYAALHDVRERLAGRLPWPIFVQGTASRTAILRDFRATAHAVLFATSSFWQGVDVAGDALSCVIVDRLPFASPADPLTAARMAATASRGGHAFHDYQVPLATLNLLQGLGRLIRTHTDRGVLAVLDPRLTRMSYGRRFLSSLPPAPITDEIEQVGRFFDSIDRASLLRSPDRQRLSVTIITHAAVR
jgi:ATP-dependent DNA helicase DinG